MTKLRYNFEGDSRKTSSINLAAYIITETGIIPETRFDEDERICYFIFPAVSGVDVAIKTFKTGNPSIRLHDFLAAIKYIRGGINLQKPKRGVINYGEQERAPSEAERPSARREEQEG